MITRQGRCKLTDFGLVRLDDPNDPFDFTDKSVGTPHFMAPEMIRHKKQTTAIDVYSLGCTLYFAITTCPPFTGDKLTDILKQHLDTPPPDVREICPDCPETLALLTQHTMAKNPLDRPSATDLAAALRAEAISLFPDDTGFKTATGSSIFHPPGNAGRHSADITSIIRGRPSVTGPPAGLKRLVKAWWFWALVAVVVAALATIVLWPRFHKQTGPSGSQTRFDSADLAERFPDAPETYGVLPANEVPQIRDLSTEPPPFSWVGHKDIDITGLNFVASKQGRHYYSIDDPVAVLISRENFVGYQTEAQARMDGKIPAP
jgi:serine/threonine protein kinase